jgi:DNA-binding transcriptional LysR family regulator
MASLAQLRAFVAVAEALHFRRAAEALRVAQPALSAQIKLLEAEVGGPLLLRDRRKVALTDAGASLLVEARVALRAVEGAVLAARAVHSGEAGRLRVGLTGSTAFHPRVTRALRLFRELHPRVELILAERNTLGLLSALRERELDAAFVRPPFVAMDGLTATVLEEEPLVVALPAGHRLARRRSLDLRDLAGETILLRPRAVGVGLDEAIEEACRGAGLGPAVFVRHAAPQMSSIIGLVAAGLGVSVVPASMRALVRGEVAYRRLTGPGRLTAPIAFARRVGTLEVAANRLEGIALGVARKYGAANGCAAGEDAAAPGRPSRRRPGPARVLPRNERGVR